MSALLAVLSGIGGGLAVIALILVFAGGFRPPLHTDDHGWQVPQRRVE